MKPLSKIAALLLACGLITLSGSLTAQTSKPLDHFHAADQIAKSEPAQWQQSYRLADQLFGKGENPRQVNEALKELEYIAYDGSQAASIRLCAIYAYGIGLNVNPGSGIFWCRQSAMRGYRPGAGITVELFETYWQDIEDEL